MRTRQWMSMLVSAAGFATLLVAGCTDSTGSRFVTVRVSLGRADGVLSASLAPQAVTAGSVDPAKVSDLTVSVDSIQMQTSTSDGWQTVNFAAPLALNLVTDLANPIDLGSVTVESGSCNVRLFVSDPMITFSEDVVFGQHTVAAGTYPVRIPSGDNTGLKADGACDATDAAHVMLAFDVGASIGNVVATGNGDIMLTPVIHVVQP
jgi:uncharacterized protein DUF4382